MTHSSDETIKAEFEPRTSISKVVNDNPDSISIGTPSKGGETKIYGNFDNPEGFKKKIDNASIVREYARSKLLENP